MRSRGVDIVETLTSVIVVACFMFTFSQAAFLTPPTCVQTCNGICDITHFFCKFIPRQTFCDSAKDECKKTCEPVCTCVDTCKAGCDSAKTACEGTGSKIPEKIICTASRFICADQVCPLVCGVRNGEQIIKDVKTLIQNVKPQ